ncbi:MAG: glutamate--tRNA ligase, partial [Alphaproteobacteria bacterium]
MTVVTRFAPSPTGFLHVGGARTALFNWLYARHFGGTYRLRLEDTDRARSTKEAIDAILNGLAWLGLDHDGEVVYQSKNAERHAEVARQLLAAGRAYYCYCSPEELAQMREKARADGKPLRYDGRWRGRDPSEAPKNVPPVVRLKAPQTGETVIQDRVQGEVRVANDQLDDMVLLRADGTPTYMLSVVVDDHDMGITHVIRGDDHLTNAFRQAQIYLAFDWPIPEFAHIPLIHGADGAKLSKRHGAVSLEAYRDMGFLPEALRNYLLRLGWSHGDAEIISTQEAIEWFDLDAVGRSAARFDLAKLTNLNGHYIRATADARLVEHVVPFIAKLVGHEPDQAARQRLAAGMPGLKQRANALVELAKSALFYVCERPIPIEPAAEKLLDQAARERLGRLRNRLKVLAEWTESRLEAEIRGFAEDEKTGLGQIAQPLRAALTGLKVSPGIFEVMATLGRDEVLG